MRVEWNGNSYSIYEKKDHKTTCLDQKTGNQEWEG